MGTGTTLQIARVRAYPISLPINPTEQHTSDFGGAHSDGVIVRIDTACGLTGYGEGKSPTGADGSRQALATLINNQLGPNLSGKDPRDVRPLWESMYNGARTDLARQRGHAYPEVARRGLTLAAISAVDIALWDIFGKSLNLPVWRLLGGARRHHFPTYASGGWADASMIASELRGYIDANGFKAVKMRVGAMDNTVSASARRVIAAREGLGPDVEIMCDAHGTFTVAEAKQFSYLIRDANVTWFEEPVSPDDKIGLAEVRRYTHVPIAAGENESTMFDFGTLIGIRGIDVVQPELAVCGGITEAMNIAALTASANLELATHMWAGAPAFAAGLHVTAASSASRIVEYPIAANPMLHELAEEGFPVDGGTIKILDRPGLGITIREDMLETYSSAAADERA